MKHLLLAASIALFSASSVADEQSASDPADWVRRTLLQIKMRNVLSICFENQDAKSHKYAAGFEKCGELVPSIHDVLDYDNALAAEKRRSENIQAVEKLSHEMGFFPSAPQRP